MIMMSVCLCQITRCLLRAVQEQKPCKGGPKADCRPLRVYGLTTNPGPSVGLTTNPGPRVGGSWWRGRYVNQHLEKKNNNNNNNIKNNNNNMRQ